MRWISVLLTTACLASPALAGIIDVQYYDTLAEVEAVAIDGFEFWAYGETEQVRVIPTESPGDAVTSPYDRWNNGIFQAFNMVYNPGGSPIGIQVADEQTVFPGPLAIHPETNSFVIEAAAMGERSVMIRNLALMLPGSPTMYNVGQPLSSGDDGYMVVQTDKPLADGFILSGEVAMTWSGDLNPTTPGEDDQWFGIAPIIIPEPASMMVIALGLLLGARRRGL